MLLSQLLCMLRLQRPPMPFKMQLYVGAIRYCLIWRRSAFKPIIRRANHTAARPTTRPGVSMVI